MAKEIKTSSFSVDTPPTNAEAMEYVQLSPTQLKQVMLDQQQNCLKNNSERLPIDQDDAFAKELVSCVVQDSPLLILEACLLHGPYRTCLLFFPLSGEFPSTFT